MADVCERHKLEQAVDHADARPQNRHDSEEVLFQHGERAHANWRFDGHEFRLEIASHFVTHELGNLLEEKAEFLGCGAYATHAGELIGNQRMVEDMNVAHR